MKPIEKLADMPISDSFLLACEDHEDNDIFAAALKQEFPSYQTHIAERIGGFFDYNPSSNGNSAINLYLAHRPRLVVLGLMLPGRSGFLVLERLYREDPQITRDRRIIMVTRNTGKRHVTYAESLGAGEFFYKPKEDYFQDPSNVSRVVQAAKRLIGKNQSN